MRGKEYPKTIRKLANHVHQPALPELTRRFLYDQLHPLAPPTDSDLDEDEGTDRLRSAALDVPLEACPLISGRIRVYHSAVATFYAPSDNSGRRGMKRERIRSVPSWRNQGKRRDSALVVVDETKLGLKGMGVVRVQLLFSFTYGAKTYPCALVDWFKNYGRAPDPVTGLWRVVPEYEHGQRVQSVIHLDSLLRGVHPLPAFGSSFMPPHFNREDTLDAFASYYVNKFADHHSHEIIF